MTLKKTGEYTAVSYMNLTYAQANLLTEADNNPAEKDELLEAAKAVRDQRDKVWSKLNNINN